MNGKAGMILSIRELLIEGRKACIHFVCLLERIEEFGLRLGGRLELTEFSSCKIIRNSIDICCETAECVGDYVCFSCLVFDFEVIGLNGQDPTDNTISGGGGEFQCRVDKKLCRWFVIRFNQEFVI